MTLSDVSVMYCRGRMADLDELISHLRGDVDAFSVKIPRLTVSTLRSEHIPPLKILLPPLLPVLLRATLRGKRSTVENDIRRDPVMLEQSDILHSILHISIRVEAYKVPGANNDETGGNSLRRALPRR